MSHMIADTEDELHQMTDKIEVRRKWYQGDHYDISLSKRRLTVLHGAKEITVRELGRMVLDNRKSLKKNRGKKK